MKAGTQVPETIDAYIAAFPADVQKRLQQLRKTIAKHAMGATECISYQIPTFKLEGNLVHFAGYQKHIGFYPGSAALVKFALELTDFATSKGTVQFPHDKAMPLKLVERMVQYRVLANLENAQLKKGEKADKAAAKTATKATGKAPRKSKE